LLLYKDESQEYIFVLYLIIAVIAVQGLNTQNFSLVIETVTEISFFYGNKTKYKRFNILNLCKETYKNVACFSLVICSAITGAYNNEKRSLLEQWIKGPWEQTVFAYRIK